MPRAHPFVPTRGSRAAIGWARRCEPALLLPHLLLLAGLRPLGFEPAELFIDPRLHGGRAPDPTRLRRGDTRDLAPDDVVVTATRWPLSDPGRGYRKQPEWASSDLAREILEVWQRLLPLLSRDRVRLGPGLRRLLPAGREDRFDMGFRRLPGAPCLALQRRDDGRRRYEGDVLRTAAFLLRLPRLPQRNVGYVGAWGIDLAASLVWAHLLRRRHADLLRAPAFVMAELVGAAIPERPTDLRWAAAWRAEILIHLPLGARA